MLFELDIHKRYVSRKRAIDIPLNVDFATNEIVALYGPSGVGKSTILRLIAGLESPDSGTIIFRNRTWFSSKHRINIPIPDRRIGFVFQDYNLFPNMSVRKNLEYASLNARIPDEINELIAITGIDAYLDSYPDELSGGQRQRVSILRALCLKPDVLLLDEPFSALDDDAIKLFIDQVKLVKTRFNMTVILISHRKDVLFAMASWVIDMTDLNKPRQGTPKEILSPNF